MLLLWRIHESKTEKVRFKRKYSDQIGILVNLFKKYGHQKVTYKKTTLEHCVFFLKHNIYV